MTSWWKRLAVVPAAFAVLLLGAGPAAAADTTIALGPQGSLVARGAAVTVSVTVTCSPVWIENGWDEPYWDSSGSLSVSLTQAVKKGRVASARAEEVPVTCTDLPQTYSVMLVASDLAFQRGPAILSAHVGDMDWPGIAPGDAGPVVISVR